MVTIFPCWTRNKRLAFALASIVQLADGVPPRRLFDDFEADVDFKDTWQAVRPFSLHNLGPIRVNFSEGVNVSTLNHFLSFSGHSQSPSTELKPAWWTPEACTRFA
jgi:hypothetical protein